MIASQHIWIENLKNLENFFQNSLDPREAQEPYETMAARLSMHNFSHKLLISFFWFSA